MRRQTAKVAGGEGNKIVTNRHLTLIIAILMLVAYCTSCAADNEGVSDYASLIDKLREAGALIEPRGEVAPHLLSGQRREVSVNDSVVTVWEFDDDATADAEATNVSATGSAVSTATTFTLLTLTASPHWYKAGSLIVLYVGESEAVTDVLERVLGTPFAPR